MIKSMNTKNMSKTGSNISEPYEIGILAQSEYFKLDEMKTTDEIDSTN